MKRLTFVTVIVLSVLVILYTNVVLASDGVNIPKFYVHGGAGIGVDVLSSPDIDALLTDGYQIGSLGFPLSLIIRSGYKNIIQVEYRKADTSHHIRKTGFVEGSGYGNTGLGTVAEVKMDYDLDESLIKFNPFLRSKFTKNGGAIFLVFGTGNVTYVDDTGDGFKGRSFIYGIEGCFIKKYSEISIGFKIHDIDFDETTLFGIKFDDANKATNYVIELSIAFGLGL